MALPNFTPGSSMTALASFRAGGKRFTFFHNNDTDGRELYDRDGTLVMIVDSSLKVTDPAGKVGDIQSEGDKWVFYYGPLRTRFETGIDIHRPGRTYCWENLERAEVIAIKHYLESKLPQFKRPTDSEGGNCD